MRSIAVRLTCIMILGIVANETSASEGAMTCSVCVVGAEQCPSEEDADRRCNDKCGTNRDADYCDEVEACPGAYIRCAGDN